MASFSRRSVILWSVWAALGPAAAQGIDPPQIIVAPPGPGEQGTLVIPGPGEPVEIVPGPNGPTLNFDTPSAPNSVVVEAPSTPPGPATPDDQ